MVKTRFCVKDLARRRERGMSHAGVSQNKAPVCLILALALLRGEGGKRMAGNVTKLTVSFG